MRNRSGVLAGTVVAAVFSLLLAATPAVAECNSETALFEDDFEFMDGSWGEPDDNFFVEDGVLVAKDYREQVNFSTQNQGGNVCVDATIAEAPVPMESPAGLIFWWQDWDNYYSVVYWQDGYLEVRRVNKGKFTVVFGLETLAIKKGLGETNHLELVLKPKDATILVNGTEVKRFKGVQPKDGGVVGVVGMSPQGSPATFNFDNFIVSE